MTRDRSDELPPLKRADEIDQVFGRANPNPDRVGCPPRNVLVALARRQRPIEDPAYDHLSMCSPCYLEVRALQEGHAVARRNRMVAWTAAAALLLVTASTAWFVLARTRTGPPLQTELATQLDLRPYAVMRGGAEETGKPPLVLPRSRVLLTLLLPVGSEPGPYEVQVLDAALASRAAGTGTAELLNQVTTLRTTLHLEQLPAGAYQLAVRRDDQDWQMFSAQLQ